MRSWAAAAASLCIGAIGCKQTWYGAVAFIWYVRDCWIVVATVRGDFVPYVFGLEQNGRPVLHDIHAGMTPGGSQ